jgi:cytochrome c2
MKGFVILGMCILSAIVVGCAHNDLQSSVRQQPVSAMIVQYGCQTCHVIPGVPGAVGKVGPSLESLNQRSYLAGTLTNTHANLQRWIMHPQSIHPGSAMPEMGVSQDDAKKLAAFLDKNQ